MTTVSTDPGLPRLEARNISKSFSRRDAQTEVLHDVSFTVEPGEFLAIVGASGCGKTTLLRIIDGLEALSSGEILVDGRPVAGPGPDRGYVFQQSNLMPWLSVIRNVALGLELQGTSRRAAIEQASESLRVVGLAGFEKYYPNEISGGMQQRANLARALVTRPEILLMDEPFAALDAQTRELMQAELQRIWSETDEGTVVFITHQIDEALFLADRVLVLASRPGRVQRVIDVDLPRPRDLSMKRSPEFVALVDEVWHLIENDVRQEQSLRTVSRNS